ncbi:MAG: Threonine-tRNA ligase [Candidatus Azambacteria bacterium GW2011_GWB2_46_37]|uniref:Threonine--tRNA ligase n=5 Tax=Candidatus Azamiibacteriota TaxID=1752741 RepID=A0A0G1Q6C2_9BACT|nr:MAG: Threonine-tRNA ligase [Candidatus Azambacteria bacterium GW2011_GWB1_46_27]KKU37874.1 MAG: Threonine-tRNA ligase [Candidatus Azambacteria bacterium GW2011_GWF2_46_32]KKU39438.1 MAG: Threonine-tRNA ligase [Candidatus Azambacteria bacterium GW2011_GWB2_46_37]KKU40586.1 MAG: Threonine-tRNA ligase [Candidatus Azambacteria bacterium GW2011_GWE2_46_45]KKU42537.1 MAG: Threonine-tRNA ligase [Candidatus Azambacteria bacterium GW2011_GWD2_46_48]HAM95827.1 threonine--tRNA ligase [Candidatus Azamb
MTYPLETIRHSYAHVLAAAIQRLFPDARFGVGPVIENGFYYDILLPKAIGGEDLPKIEQEMKRIIKQNLKFEKEETGIDEAIAFFQKTNQPFKVELLKDLKTKGTTAMSEEEQKTIGKEVKIVSIYKTGGFVDLCRGPHVASTKELPADAFKLTKIAGAYWRGSEKNPMLTRIYGAGFIVKKDLEKYLWQQEEIKKRDHRVLGEKLKLFTFAEEVGPGLPLWLPNGTILRDEIENYAKEIEKKWGYRRVATPHIAKETLYRMSGHIPYYAESMFPPMKLDDGNYYLKAMNCPHTHMIYKSEPKSYRDLPLRLAEYGTVYRYELSGTLAGLLRTRGFTQNDAHIYCREDQVEAEFLKVMKLHEFWYKKVFGIKDFYMRLSLPAKDKAKYADIPEGWKKSVEMIRRSMQSSKLPFVEAEGEAAFYGPKVDFQIKSIVGREETASTNQLDFLAAQRFNLNYRDKDGEDKPVYVIHRAPLGSHERFIAFLIEHFAGAFPLWLAPVQAWILPIGKAHKKYGARIAKELLAVDIRAELKDQNETVGKKIREGENQKIPYLLIVGDKEMKNESVAVRKRAKGDLGAVKFKKFLARIKEEIVKKK